MLSFAHPLRWPIWSTLWCYVSKFFMNAFRPFHGQLNDIAAPVQREDVEQYTSTEGGIYNTPGAPPTNYSHKIITVKHRPVVKQSSNQKLLRIGIFAEVYLVDGKIIRKVPCSEREEDTLPVVREATIYTILGDHPRIAQCLSPGKTDYIDIKYYSHGDLAAYMQGKKITPDLQSKWFQQIIEAVAEIHRHDIIHSDLALRQFFLDDNLNVRLGDFNSSQYPGHPALGYEKAPHCLPRDYEAPNTTMSDLFALGSTLYELVAGKAPYNERYPIEPEDVMRSSDHGVIRARVQRRHQVDSEIEALYRNQIFPDVSDLFGGDIILGCWKRDFSSAKEALARYILLIKDV